MQPLVSVIVPVYGVEPYIGKFARSLFSQTYPAIRFIFVDDGTKDRSIEVLEELIDKEFPLLKSRILILHQENAGLPQARRTGLQHADGDFVLHLDSDDWIEPDMVARLVDAAERTQADLVYCDFFKEYGSRTCRGREAEYRHIAPMLTDLIRGRRIHGFLVNKLIRRDLYRDHALCPSVASIREDLVQTFQLIYYSRKTVHLPLPLYHYRKNNATSLRHSSRTEHYRQCAVNQLNLYAFYRDKDRPNPVSVIRDAFLFQTLWYVYKAEAWDMLGDYPGIREDARMLRLPLSMLDRIPRYFRLRRELRKRGIA